MLIRVYQLTKEELYHLVTMPCDSDEAIRFNTALRIELDKRYGTKIKVGKGRWYPLVWFCQFERIMEVDEMMAAIRRFGDEETFEMLKIV